MKRFLLIAVSICLAFFVQPAFAHHMAAGIVDEEIYEMIDNMVADTPHATLDLSQVSEGGMVITTTIITTRAAKFLEDMIADGIMDFFPMLDGAIMVNIEYGMDNNRSVTMTITQVEPEE